MLNQEINQKKLNFNEVYNLRNPEPYYKYINEYEYYLPERAKPYFLKVINAYRHYESVHSLKILDLGCSYGVNAAIIKCNKSIAELHRHYSDPAYLEQSELERRNLDNTWFQESSCDEGLQFIGLDSAQKAVDYAVESELMESGISTNLEKSPLLKEDYTDLQDINILISTGCVGYITEITFDKILSAVKNLSQLWGAVFILKMFDLSQIKKTLAKYDLILVNTGVTVRQRQFSSVDEKQSMINFIDKQGLSTEAEKESDNLLARLFLILPSSVTSQPSIQKLLDELRNIPD